MYLCVHIPACLDKSMCVCVRVCVRAQYFSHVGGCSVV